MLPLSPTALTVPSRYPQHPNHYSASPGTSQLPRLCARAQPAPLTHVLQCAHASPQLPQHQGVVGLGAAKINDLESVCARDHNVVRLDVKVHNAAAMQVLEALQQLQDVAHHIVL